MGLGVAALLREASPGSLLAGAAAVLLLWWAAAVLEWAWLVGAGSGFESLVFKISNSAIFFDSSNIYILVEYN